MDTPMPLKTSTPPTYEDMNHIYQKISGYQGTLFYNDRFKITLLESPSNHPQFPDHNTFVINGNLHIKSLRMKHNDNSLIFYYCDKKNSIESVHHVSENGTIKKLGQLNPYHRKLVEYALSRILPKQLP